MTIPGHSVPGAQQRLRLFLEFAPEAGPEDVPDPYYGGPNGFEEVLDLVEAATRGLLAYLRQGSRAAAYSSGPWPSSLSEGADDQTT